MSDEEAIMEPKEEQEEEEQEEQEEGEEVSKSPHPKAPLSLLSKNVLWKSE